MSDVYTLEGTWSSIALGDQLGCALAPEGRVDCWSWNDQEPALVAPDETFTQITAGFDVACGLRPDGTIACWGTDDPILEEIPEGTFSQVDLGAGYGCAVSTEGDLACWGDAGYGGIYGADEPPQ